MVTALLLCMAVWLHFEHSEPAVKSIFGCTNQKSYDGLFFTTMHGCFTMFWTFGANNKNLILAVLTKNPMSSGYNNAWPFRFAIP